MVDRVIQGAMPAPADFTLTWESNHFTKGQEGRTYIAVHDASWTRRSPGSRWPSTSASWRRARRRRRRAGSEGQGQQERSGPARTYPWERISFTQVPASGKMSRAFVLKPGEYDVYIMMKEKFDEGR